MGGRAGEDWRQDCRGGKMAEGWEQGWDGTGQTADFFILLISQDLSRPKLLGPWHITPYRHGNTLICHPIFPQRLGQTWRGKKKKTFQYVAHDLSIQKKCHMINLKCQNINCWVGWIMSCVHACVWAYVWIPDQIFRCWCLSGTPES